MFRLSSSLDAARLNAKDHFGVNRRIDAFERRLEEVA
jgi:hypothetical protein